MTIGDKTTIRLDINISDFDGDSLTLNIESNDSILTIGKNFINPILQADYIGGALDFNITSGSKISGSAIVTITLSDGNANVSKRFIVNILYNYGDELRAIINACNNLNSINSVECKRVVDYNTSSITDMNNMFYNFKHDINISNWDTSRVNDMSYMFYEANNFNHSLNSWDTSKVTNMGLMFYKATNFNQPLKNWDTSRVTNMSFMFNNATNFNQPIDDWNTSSVTNMSGMFYVASNFNQPLNSWDTSKVTDMSYMFSYANFN